MSASDFPVAPITYPCRVCGGRFDDIRELWHHACVPAQGDDQIALELDDLDEQE